jgi:MraZ protein
VATSVFTGEYRHAVDGKGRVAVPARFRDQLAGEVVVARWLEPCLAVFPKAAWEQLADKIDGLRVVDPIARQLERRLFAWAFETELDKQGRMLLPQNLRDFAGLEVEAVVAGVSRHVEVWSPTRWDDNARGLFDSDEFGQSIASLGI